jgi:hypothetical protein
LLYQFGGKGARQEVAFRVARRAQADVAVGVDDAVRREDAVGSDEIFELFLDGVLLNPP